MKTFADVPNITGVFPNVLAQDETVVDVSDDGTRLVAHWVNEFFGWVQATMDGADVVPNATIDCAATGSQILQAIRHHCGNAGEVVAWMGPTVPAGVRLLALNGQSIIVADYSELVTNVYCGDLANHAAPAFFRHDGGVRNPAGTRMELPDLRGFFLRGLGGMDPDPARVYPGSAQIESIAQHSHDKLFIGGVEWKKDTTGTAGATGATIATSGTSLKTGVTGTGIGALVATNETRPDNIATTWCIRY